MSQPSICIQALNESVEKYQMRPLAYCIMPDHIHLLLRGAAGTNLITFVKLFKQLSGYWYRNRFGSKLWQKGYYDHIVRREDDLPGIARYILANPVRAGLVENWD